MEIKAYLNPNPAFSDEPLVNAWGVKYEMANEPFLEVEIYKPPEKRFKIIITKPFRIEKEVKISSEKDSIFFKDRRFENPGISEIKIRVEGEKWDEEFILPIKVYEIKGIAKDFNGNPLSVYLWHYEVGKCSIMRKADKKGRFNFWFPAGKGLKLFVCDRNYAKKYLECWVMSERLRDNIKITPVVGNFELWEYKVWLLTGSYPYPIWNIFFVPAIVDKEIPPEIEKKDVNVYMNEKKAKIRSFTPYKVYFKGEKEGDYYPAYIISGVTDIKFEDLPPKIIIKTVVNSKKKDICGEGWYIYYKI